MSGATISCAGGGIPVISLTNTTVVKSNAGTATASYSIGNDGRVTTVAGGFYEYWDSASWSVANYEVRATQVSGVTIAGTLGSWLNCGTTRTWSITGTGSNLGTMTVQIRDATSLAVLASATITIDAEGA